MKNTKYISIMSAAIAIIVFIIFIGQSSSEQTVLAVNQSDNHQDTTETDSNTETTDEEEREQELSHDKIVSLTDQFMNTLVQEIDHTNKVIHVDTKADLLQEFKKISTKNVAMEYVEFYYEEDENGLYIKPTETPPWFHEDNDYDMIQKDSKTIELVQENTTDLYGTYTINIEFTWDDNQWYITKISHQ